MDFLKKIYHRLPIVRQLLAGFQEMQRLRAIQCTLLQRDIFRQDPRFKDHKSLARYEHQVFSQAGEDGVIREIFRRIGTTDETFVEFGVEAGVENNTHFLLCQGWSGNWIEGSRVSVEKIHNSFRFYLDEGKLKVLNALITKENIEELFVTLGIPQNLDLLSIDIDGNDYWIWEKLGRWQPRVVVIEYNSHFPSDCEWILPYDASHTWKGDHRYGASLKSLELLGRRLGYSLVYCNVIGSNAFFVRSDLVASHFPENDTAEYHYQPFRPFLVFREGHRASA